MVYIAPDDSPSAGELVDPAGDLADQLGGGGDDDDDYIPFQDNDDDPADSSNDVVNNPAYNIGRDRTEDPSDPADSRDVSDEVEESTPNTDAPDQNVPDPTFDEDLQDDLDEGGTSVDEVLNGRLDAPDLEGDRSKVVAVLVAVGVAVVGGVSVAGGN